MSGPALGPVGSVGAAAELLGAAVAVIGAGRPVVLPDDLADTPQVR